MKSCFGCRKLVSTVAGSLDMWKTIWICEETGETKGQIFSIFCGGCEVPRRTSDSCYETISIERRGDDHFNITDFPPAIRLAASFAHGED